MTVVQWVRSGFEALRGKCWGDDCPRGIPVPSPDRCADCDAVAAGMLGVGERGRVTCLLDPADAPARKLAALGVLPGAELLMLQRSPAIVFRIGHAELALDAELAGRIRVRRE